MFIYYTDSALKQNFFYKFVVKLWITRESSEVEVVMNKFGVNKLNKFGVRSHSIEHRWLIFEVFTVSAAAPWAPIYIAPKFWSLCQVKRNNAQIIGFFRFLSASREPGTLKGRKNFETLKLTYISFRIKSYIKKLFWYYLIPKTLEL